RNTRGRSSSSWNSPLLRRAPTPRQRQGRPFFDIEMSWVGKNVSDDGSDRKIKKLTLRSRDLSLFMYCSMIPGQSALVNSFLHFYTGERRKYAKLRFDYRVCANI